MGNKIVILNNTDNVGVAIIPLKKGEFIKINDNIIKVLNDIEFGHKIALADVYSGEKILKYGVPVGVASTSIIKGEHVHTHNMKSLYVKQFTK